jgi:hypothetical protein
MRRLGHSSISVTFDTYGHLFPDRQEEITKGLEAAWERASNASTPHDADVMQLR